MYYLNRTITAIFTLAFITAMKCRNQVSHGGTHVSSPVPSRINRTLGY